MDEVYRGYCISVRLRSHRYVGRITSVRGPALTAQPAATIAEGSNACLLRSRQAIDHYIAFLLGNEISSDS